MAEVNPTSLRRGHEVGDVPSGRLFLAGVLALAGLGLVLVLVWGLAALFIRGPVDRKPAPSSLATVPVPPPPPRLQPDPARDLQAFRAAEEKELHTLGWVDRRAGTARIPVEDAMALLAAHGWPTEEP